MQMKSTMDRHVTCVIVWCHQESKNGVRDGLVPLNAPEQTVAEHGLHLGRGPWITRFRRPNA